MISRKNSGDEEGRKKKRILCLGIIRNLKYHIFLVIPLEEDDQEEDFFLNFLSNIFDIRFGKAVEKLSKSCGKAVEKLRS